MMRLAQARRLLAAAVLLVAAGFAWGANLAAGPMAGHRDARSTLIWLQADAATAARIEYWQEGDERRRRVTEPVRLAAASDFAAQVAITGLTPGTTYHYRVLLDGREARVAQPLTFRTEALWMWQKHSFIAAQGHVPRDFRFAFGSCTYVNDPPFDRSTRPSGPSPDPSVQPALAWRLRLSLRRARRPESFTPLSRPARRGSRGRRRFAPKRGLRSLRSCSRRRDGVLWLRRLT